MNLSNDTGGEVLDADGGLALIVVLAAGAGGLEGVHLSLSHELLVCQFQVFFPLPILNMKRFT